MQEIKSLFRDHSELENGKILKSYSSFLAISKYQKSNSRNKVYHFSNSKIPHDYKFVI